MEDHGFGIKFGNWDSVFGILDGVFGNWDSDLVFGAHQNSPAFDKEESGGPGVTEK